MPTIISYPKSGRHWCEALICQALAFEHGLDCSDFNRMKKHVMEAYNLEFSHWYVNIFDGAGQMDIPLNPKKETVFAHIVRDPRDVAVSCYYWRQIETPLKDFIIDHNGQLPAIIEFLNYIHTMTDNFYSYEDLHTDTQGTLKRIMTSIGLRPSDKALQHAINASTMDALRKKDKDEETCVPQIYRKGQSCICGYIRC